MEDATTDHPSRISPDLADLPFHRRLRTERTEQGIVDRPATARSTVLDENGSTRIVIPQPQVHPALFALMVLTAVIPMVIFNPLALFFRQTGTPAPVGWFFLGFLLFMFIGIPASIALNAFMRSRRGQTIVTISASGVRIQERGAWFTNVTASHQLADVIDLDFSTTESLLGSARRQAEQSVIQSRSVAPAGPAIGPRTERIVTFLSQFARGRGVTLKTQRGLTSFGQGLSDEEIRYLYSVVRRALVRSVVE